MNTAIKTGAKIGATVGAVLYPFLGVMPAFYFGSYGALILMNKLMGSLEPTLIVRMAVVAGVGVGLFSAACLFLVVGGLLGTAVGLAVQGISAKEVATEKA